MGSETNIAWCDHTFNPWIGCAKVSEACKYCYAEVETFPRVQRGRGLELWGADAARHTTSDGYWRKPLAWAREARDAGVRARVFCASMADVFEDRRDLDGLRYKLFSLIEQTQSMDWLLLTKRPERVRDLVPVTWRWGWPDNVWLGVTAENQARVDERVPLLLSTGARVKFLSCEPLLEDVKIRQLETQALASRVVANLTAGLGVRHLKRGPNIDWVIVGGESGPKARAFDLAWADSIVRQCADAKVACFVKQLGSKPVVEDADGGAWERYPQFDSKGGDPTEWPSDLRVRQFPGGAT
jgi:protein gp37